MLMAQNRVANRTSPFPNPPTPSQAVTASPSSQPRLPHPSLPGTRMGRTSPDPADGETHGPGCTTPHCRTAGAEPGATGRTASILHGDVHCLFHNTCQLPSQTLLEVSCLLEAHDHHQAWWQGSRPPSHRAPHHPLRGMGLGDLSCSCEERAALSCPRVEDV